MSVAQVYFPEVGNFLEKADKVWHLQQSRLVEGLSAQEVQTLAASCINRIYQTGEVIFHQGDPAHELFIINRGTVCLSVGTPDGSKKVITVLKAGDIFGEEVIAPQQFRQAQAVAHEECWVSALSQDRLLDLLGEKPIIALNFLRLLNRELVEVRKETEILSFSNLEYRIARVLLKLAAEHGKQIGAGQLLKKLRIFVSHELLAQMVGANRPYVSSILSDFKKRGWIQYERRKLLVDTNQLSRALALESED